MAEVVVVAGDGAEDFCAARGAGDDIVFAWRVRGDGVHGRGEDEPGGMRVAVLAGDVGREGGGVWCAGFEGYEGDGD